MKLVEKARAFQYTDANTPIIGIFVIKTMEYFEANEFHIDSECEGVAPWGSRFKQEVQYPNEKGDWMVDFFCSQFPDVSLGKFHEWIGSTHNINDMLKPPLLEMYTPAKSEIPVVVDGDNVGPPPCVSSGIIEDSRLNSKDIRHPDRQVRRNRAIELLKEKGVYDPNYVPKTRTPEERVATQKAFKERLVSEGKWVEPKSKENLSPDEKRQKFLALKEKKMKAGTWVDKNPSSDTSSVKSANSGYRELNARTNAAIRAAMERNKEGRAEARGAYANGL
jgi:hypothetical protein